MNNNSKIYHGGSDCQNFRKPIPIIPIAEDIKVKIDENDTETDFLKNKIVAGSGITLTELITPITLVKQLEIKTNVDDSLKKYSLGFGQASAVAVGTHIPSIINTGWQSNTCGYYIRKRAKIKRLECYCPKFITYNTTSYIRFQLKTIVMDGSRTSDITDASGTNLINYDLVLPNTSGNYRYYKGDGTDIDLTVNAGEMIWAVHCAITANTALGSGCWIYIEEF